MSVSHAGSAGSVPRLLPAQDDTRLYAADVTVRNAHSVVLAIIAGFEFVHDLNNASTAFDRGIEMENQMRRVL